MPLPSELIEYIHHYNLTCDPGWTLDFAEDLVQQISIAFPLDPPCRSLSEEIEQICSSFELTTGLAQNQKLALPIQDLWLFPKQLLHHAKCFQDSIKQYNHTQLDVVALDWWYDGPFEPQMVHILGDFLIRRTSKQNRNSSQLADFRRVKNYICASGQELSAQVLLEEEPIQIPQPEDLTDTVLRLTPSQYQAMREHKIRQAKIFMPLGMNSDILASDEEDESKEDRLREISPPLQSRISSSFGKSWSRNAQELVSSVLNNFKVENILECSPSPSNTTWNAIDSCCQRLPFTPPSSPTPSEIKKYPEIPVDFLSPSALEHGDGSGGLENPFETVLFSRTDGMPIHLDRSTSFNPRNHLDAASFLLDNEDHKLVRASLTPEPTTNLSNQEEDQTSLNIMKELVANKTWDDKQFEREIFGSPGCAANPHSLLKRIPIKVPDSPQRDHGMNEELMPFNNKFVRSQEGNKPGSNNLATISQGLNKVEGLRALNIELKWNAYNFQPSNTIEKLTNVEFEPLDEVNSEVSSSKQVDSFVSKRLKTNHNYCELEDEWLKPSDLLDQSNSFSSSCTSISDIDGGTLHELDGMEVGSASMSHSLDAADIPNTTKDIEIVRTYQSEASYTHFTEESEVGPKGHESQTGYLTDESKGEPVTEGIESQAGYDCNESLSFLKDDGADDLLAGLKPFQPLSDLENNDLYNVWTTSDSSS